MKKIFILLLGTFFLPIALSAQQKVVRLTRYEGKQIRGVSASTAFNVHLIQSNETKAVVEINEELEHRLNFSLNDDGIVNISLSLQTSDYKSKNWRNNEITMKLTVYLPRLDYIKASGATNIYTAGLFEGNNTTILVSGASNLKSLDLKTEALTIKASGASNTKIKVDAGKIHGEVVGASRMSIEAKCGHALLECTGASRTTLSGEAQSAEIKVTGASNTDASQFEVRKMKVNSSGASSAKVWVTNELDANASSASSIRYKGNPQNFSTKSSSASSVKQLN